jgi:hypothetical protein
MHHKYHQGIEYFVGTQGSGSRSAPIGTHLGAKIASITVVVVQTRQIHHNPQGRGEAHRGEIVAGQPIVAYCDAPEVLQPVESGFNAPAWFVRTECLHRCLCMARILDEFGGPNGLDSSTYASPFGTY